MKNSTLAFLARFGCLLLSSLFVNITATKAQCYMVCNNNVPVSLDENCEAVILPDDILEGFETTPCEGPFIIEIYDLDDNLIPTSPMVNGDHIGQTLTVHAIDGESTNYCWGTILVEDKMAPVMTNCEPLALPCTVDPQPMAGQPFIGSTGYARFPSRGIGPHVSTISESFWVDLPDNAFIVDVNIVLEIEHSASEHLDVYLSNPSGTVVELGTDLCGAFPNWSVTFADDAPVQAASACNAAANPTLSGIVQPEGQLSDFNNLPAKGAWTLSITDDTNGDGGTLHGIWLTIEYILLAAYQPTATDNCGTATLTHTDAITPGTCNDPFSQIIDRTWTATDQSGNTSQCVQTITFNRLALGDVVLPPDFDGISLPALLCDDKTPGNLTSPNIGWNALSNGHPSPYDAYYPAPNDHIVKWYGTGLPVGTCDKIQYTYNDQRIEICPGTGSDACFKILRTWTLTDWCTGEVRTARQIIKVADNEAPTIEDIEDVTIGTDPHSCQATWLASLPTLLDNCNPAAQLSYSLNSSSGIISPLANNRYQVSGLKLGMHIITYTASDCCGNEATKTIKLTVVDSQPPTAVCDEHTQIILTIDGTTKAFAHTFDDQSHDNCGQVYFKLVRMDEMDSNGNGIRPESVSQGDWASIACDAVNGDDDAGQPGSQSYFDDFAKFCCDDADADFVQVVFRTFDIDPGAGPVDPTRMEAGGDLYGRYNDCMVEAVIVDKSPPIISYPDDVTLLCYEDYRDTSLTGMPEVFDNCALDTTFFEDDPDLNPCQVGKVTRTWTAIDGNGLSKSCTQMITLIDTTAPMIFFPPDTVVGCGESMEPDSTGRAYGTDDCSILYVNYKDLLFEFPDSCTRKILRTWTVLDWCTGEQWTDLQAIKEFDQQPPVIVGVPNDTLVDCDQVPPPPAIGSDLVGEDNCDRDVDIDFDENRIDGDCPYNYTLQRIWTAEDNCGNVAVDTQIISVVDTIAPEITGLPADLTLECDEPNPPAVTPTVTDNCNPDPRLSSTESMMPGDCEDNFTIVRSWTATDTCGNSRTATQTITFDDTTPPVISGIPASLTLECDEAVPPNAMPSATDNCDPMPVLSMSEQRIDGSCEDQYTIIRTWMATDRCGNSSTRNQQIVFEDTTPPVISGVPANLTLECDEPVPPAATPTATDNCDPDPHITLSDELLPGNCDDQYTLVRTWTAIDDCGNTAQLSQRISVEDTTPPVISGVPANLTLECDEPIPPGTTPSATDNCDPDPELTMGEQRIDGICEDNYTIVRSWTATDRCGNSSSMSQQIHFEDTTPPVLIGVPADITAECIDNSNPVVTATDNCDPMVEINMTTTSADPCVGNNVRILTWTATDNCGNTSTTSQQITLEDTTPPTLTGVPDDVTAECDAIPPRMDPVATDTCSGVLIVFEEERQDGRCDNEYLLIRRWMATDGCGNVVVDSQRVNVVDTTPPVLSGIPNDTTVICTEVPDPPEIGTEITASDNCDAMVDIRAEADTLPGNCVNQFTIRRIWVATDDCENESRDTQLINLIDTIPPIINGVPNDTTILCDAAVPPFNSQTIGTTDVCTSLVSISIKADTLAGRCENEFTIQRIWIATDDCENESRDTQFIQILDTIPPVLVGVPDDVTVSCDDVPEPPSIGGEITATDNCDDLVDISLAMDSLPGRCPNEFILRRIWTAIDNCDNMSRDTQLIQLIDTIPPVITGVPDDIEVLCESVPLPPDISTIGATDNCDPDPELSFVADTLPGSCTYEFTIRRIWIATDTCDNMSRDTQLISVMDTLPPLLTGVPADTMVECSEIPDAPVIGAGVAATDNCDTMVVIQLIVDSLPGNCENEYTLVRIWTAEDDCGNMSRDTQNLFVFDNTPPVLSGIPNDTTADCRDMIAMPVVTATDNCDTLVTIRLDVQQDGPCAHTFGITRIWTATDNCGNSSTASQMIFIEDSIPPVLTVPAPIRFEIRHGDSCDVFLPLIATAMDNCDDNVTITHNFAMAHDPFSTTGDASGDYPIGDRFVVFTAVDACGNTTIDSTRIQVVDKFGPAFMCQSFTDTLDPVTGYFILEPGDIMVFAQDLCSPPETMTFSPISSPNPLFDTITCDDAPVIPLEFIEVTDAAGNTNVCGASVNVIQPNPIFCDTFTPAPPGYWIAGQLSTEEGDYIEAADVMISGAMNAQAVNEAYGFYYFNGVEGGYNYSVQPEKNDDPLNGVSTFDLVLISKHILGISPLSSPYKLIAADINNSGTITTFDIVELRKLILFINTEFPHNTSWRFIDADFTFPLSNDPFSSTFPEFYSINNLSENKMDVHFTGIKIGDVNGSVQAHNLLDADSRNAQRLPLVVEDQLVEAGESVEVSFQAADFKNIEGFQLSLGFDQQLLELEEIGQTTQLTGLTRESFGTALVDKGVLTMSWFDSKPTSKDDGAALFSLRFRAKATALLSKALHLADGYTSAEAYPAGAAPLGLQLQFEQPLQSLPQADFQLFQNRPNPFADETIIPFYLPQPTEAVLSVYDVSGKLVLQRKASYAAGYQELRVSVGELSGAQLYYYQLKTERYMATRKMVFQGP